MADDRSNRDEALSAHERAERERRTSGEPNTGGTKPGGAPTGLRRSRGVPDDTAGLAGAASGGTYPTIPAGTSGRGAGGVASRDFKGGQLFTHDVDTGGARNMPHGAERASENTAHGQNDPTVGVDNAGGLHLAEDQDDLGPEADKLSIAEATDDNEPSPTTTSAVGRERQDIGNV